MVKGCMLRMGYDGSLNSGNYLKSKFIKPFKFLIHSVLQSLSHCKGGYDAMRDYQMNIVTALVLNKKYNFSHIVFHYMVENITSKSKTWVYPRFVQMMIDHAYPGLERDEDNDLLVQSNMSNDSLKQLAIYHPNHPEPKKKVEFFGFIKDKNYVDPDPVNHLNWRNDEEMKEAGYADELKVLEEFKGTRNDWFVKEQKKRGRKATPKAQTEEGSSSQPKKRQKKAAKTMLIDEPDEEEPETVPEVEVEVEKVAETETDENVRIDVCLSPNSERLLKKLNKFNAQKDKAAAEDEGDDVNKSTTSSSSSSEDVIDETERYKKVMSGVEKEKQKKRKRSDKDDDDDDKYIPSQEDVEVVQTPPSSAGRKKASAQKKIVSPKVKKPLKIVLKKKPTQKPSKPPSPPPEPTPHQSPIHSPLHQSPPRQPSQLHLSPLHIHTVTPPQEQTLLTSQPIFQTPPPSQPHVQSTSGSSGYKSFPNIPHEGISLEEIGDFNFASDVQLSLITSL
ncbi:hypothetical protein Hdeb2414_s0001g00014021 [Helianthus debilis subsp. tardiflorus]